jgi:simple sugar transport system ATP-binding protein
VVKAVRECRVARIDGGDRLGGGLSGEKRQALAIARAAPFGARVVIPEEPAADDGVQKDWHILRVVLEAQRRGTAVIVITNQVTIP